MCRPVPYSKYRFGSTQLLNTDPIVIQIHNTVKKEESAAKSEKPRKARLRFHKTARTGTCASGLHTGEFVEKLMKQGSDTGTDSDPAKFYDIRMVSGSSTLAVPEQYSTSMYKTVLIILVTRYFNTDFNPTGQGCGSAFMLFGS